MFGERLRYLRSKTPDRQEDVAKKLGIARTTYAMYEQGKREPDNDTLQKIADFFDVSIDYLLGRTDDPSPTEKLIDTELNDPELGLWFKELKEAPEQKREELRQIWEIIKQREAGRNPGDKQKK